MKSTDQGQVKAKIYNDTNLSAMELVDLANLQKYLYGEDQNYSRKMPCTQSSDSHDLESIGSRSTLLKMDHLSIDGLKQAFNDPTLNIKFPDNWKEYRYPHIKAMRVSKGFLGKDVMEFNPNLNCLIGGAGSGKSTVIEFLRFAFDQISDYPDIEDDCYGKLRDLARVGATVQVSFVTSEGKEYIVSRTFDDQENPIVIRNIKETKSIDDIDVKLLFPINAYSQGETLKIAKDRLAQLDLIDDHIDLQDYPREIKKAYKELEAQSSGLANLEAVIRDRELVIKNLSTYNEKANEIKRELEKIEEAKESEVVKNHQHWENEKNYLSNLVKSIDETRKNIENVFDNIELPILGIPFPEDDTLNKDLIARCKQEAESIIAVRNSARDSFLKGLAELEKNIRKDAGDWKVKYKEHEVEYGKILGDKGEQKIKDLNDELSSYNKKIFNAKSELQKIDAAKSQYDKQIKLRKEILEKIKDRKSRIVVLRQKKAKEIVKSIDGLRIDITPDGYREEYKNFISSNVRYSQLERHVRPICENIHPVTLAELIRNKDIYQIAKLSGIGNDWAERVINDINANSANIYLLESIPVEDNIEIFYKVDDEFRALEKLSTGQKATVIVSLSLLEKSSPIIFDQPEDALYSPFIFKNIVKLIRESKEKRQFIFATHNPNIAVASGLDLGIVLEGSSTEASIYASGGMDDSDTRKLLILHLEGGGDAIQTRLKAYQLPQIEQ